MFTALFARWVGLPAVSLVHRSLLERAAWALLLGISAPSVVVARLGYGLG